MVLKKFVPAYMQVERTYEPFPWLLVYFRQIYGQDSSERAYRQESLHFAYSWDGVRWTAINQNQPVYVPEIEGCTANIRDPFLGRGPDGYFHLLCTEGTKGWCSKNIIYTRSQDLIHWEETRRIPVLEPACEAKNVWAPEFVYDPVQQNYFVYWSTTLAENVWVRKHIWYARTQDFRDFTTPRPLFDPGLNIIDAHILLTGGQSYMFFKPDTENSTKHVRIAVADGLEGPYQIFSEGITPPVSEGPQLMRRSNPDSWYLYYDLAYTNGYGLSISKDLIHWETIDHVHFPEDARHGSFLPVSEDELAWLLWRYDFRFLVEDALQPSILMDGATHI